MTLPTRALAIFSTLQGTQTLTQSQPCKELKMPSPQAHPPPSGRNSYELHLKHRPIAIYGKTTTMTPCQTIYEIKLSTPVSINTYIILYLLKCSIKYINRYTFAMTKKNLTLKQERS